MVILYRTQCLWSMYPYDPALHNAMEFWVFLCRDCFNFSNGGIARMLSVKKTRIVDQDRTSLFPMIQTNLEFGNDRTILSSASGAVTRIVRVQPVENGHREPRNKFFEERIACSVVDRDVRIFPKTLTRFFVEIVIQLNRVQFFECRTHTV